MKTKHCPLCKKEIFSELEEDCKMCEMPLNNKQNKFCSNKCEKTYWRVGA